MSGYFVCPMLDARSIRPRYYQGPAIVRKRPRYRVCKHPASTLLATCQYRPAADELHHGEHHPRTPMTGRRAAPSTPTNDGHDELEPNTTPPPGQEHTATRPPAPPRRDKTPSPV